MKFINNKAKRVLWFCNHETLREFEVPLLRTLGYEVYLPKIFPQTEEYSSASLDTSYDASLTIPKEALDLLNKHDFYEKQMTDEIEEILNTYFSIAFFAFYPNIFEQMVEGFLGKLVFRAFGREGSNGYSDLIPLFFSPVFTKSLERIQDRFYFAHGYRSMLEVEDGIFYDRALYLPIGVSLSLFQHEDSWTGREGKLLFVCPRITSSPYYKNVYDDFKKSFSHIPHLIAGRQLFSLDDPVILGALSKTRYQELFQTSCVMFCHSQEQRQVHYHPLEAVVFGLPLVYMHNSMLGRLVQKKLPGACDTLEEAEVKIQRIMQGDASFIQEVKTSQKELLSCVHPTYCYEVWKKNLGKLCSGCVHA